MCKNGKLVSQETHTQPESVAPLSPRPEITEYAFEKCLEVAQKASGFEVCCCVNFISFDFRGVLPPFFLKIILSFLSSPSVCDMI